MKKNIIALLFVGFAGLMSAQTEYDALRLSQTDLTGTARYMSLGGAMGALGADASATKDNPAALGVYRSSEMSATLNFSLRKINPIEWQGKTSIQEGTSSVGFDNLSYIMAFYQGDSQSGLVSSNLSFSYQKLNNFNKTFQIKGAGSTNSFTGYLAAYSSPNPPIKGDVSYQNYDMPWLTVLGFDGYLINIAGQNFESLLKPGELVDPAYEFNQSGELSEYSIGWGGNYNNNLFLGVNMNVRTLEYQLSSTLTEDFQGGGGFDLVNKLTQTGLGANAKFGVIYMPTNGLRLGLSVHTPSIMYFNEESYADLHSTEIPSNEKNPATTPVNSQAFNLWSPMQVQASAALLFGKRGFISGEYNFINYQGARFNKNANSVQNFGDINFAMKDVLNNVHVLKAGAELRVTPNFALRAGYATYTPAVNSAYNDGKLLVRNSVNTNTEFFNQNYNTNYITLGLGYRTSSWFFDFAYVMRSQKEDFYTYQDRALRPALIEHKTNNLVFTAGLKM